MSSLDRGREPVMTDVAALAGVSHQTVSRVLNKHPNVSEKTRNRVLAAIHELSYRPNRAAKTLVTGRTQTIGVVVQGSTLFGPASLLSSFEEAAGAAGFAVSVSRVQHADSETVREAVERHLDQRVAGIVIIAPVTSANAALDSVQAQVPLVMIDGDPSLPRHIVTIDQREGARQATQYLLDAGHASVWHVAGPSEWFDSQGRVEGWRATLDRAGVTVPPLLTGDWSAASGYEAGQVLARIPDVTAVFAGNDHMALGILLALHEHGRRVPEEVSVVGFDDVPESAYFVPPLTTVHQEFAAVGRATLRSLLEQLDDDSAPPAVTAIAPRLVERSSVARP